MMARIYASLTTSTTEKLPSDYHSHFLHCVDYLRQGIMCSADLTMEPHDVTDADDNSPLDRSWNSHHSRTQRSDILRCDIANKYSVCKDFSYVMPYLEGNFNTASFNLNICYVEQ
jgi:hypothetical protein